MLKFKKKKKNCINWYIIKSISNGLCKPKILSIIKSETQKKLSNELSIPRFFFGSWTVAHQVWWATVHSSNAFFLL